MKKLRSSIRKFFKDKWNIAISILILIVTALGIAVVGLFKTIIIAAVVVGLVLLVKYSSSLFVRKPKRIHEKKSHEKKSKKKWGKLASAIFITVLTSGIIMILCGVAFMGYIVVSAPKFDKQKLLYKEASVLYDINGKEVDRMGTEMRDKVTYDEIPQVFVDAIIATEDSRFFEHNGFDLPRFLKASAGQVLGNSSAGGASTISMQVIKNNFTNTNRSITRKFTDIYMAVFKLEKTYTKEQILEFYVNDIHLGVNNSFGISETSRNLFGKEIGNINLSQAALLAGMFQAPNAYNPYNHPEQAAARRHTVLYLMNLHGYITKEQMKIADSMPISSIIVPQNGSGKPYQNYIDYVASEVEEKTGYDPMEVPMKIYTNLNTSKQDYVNSVLNGTNFKWENDAVQAGIAVVDVNTGAILALGGGRGEHTGAKTVNLATDIKRQVGSTAKPLFDYGPGMEFNNWSTYTPFVDDVYSYTNGPEIHNWDNKYKGMLTLRYALGQSRNIPALKAFQQVDNKKIISFVESLGITPEIESGRIHEAHAIGGFNGASPLQLAAAYAAFANGGYYIKPYSINKVELIDTGDVMTYKPEKTKVMSDSTAYMITNVLKYAVDNKFVSGRINGVEVAAKSGTSNFDEATKRDKNLASNAINDLWYAGYSPDIAISMWYGYEKISSEHYSRSPSSSMQRDKLFSALATGLFDKTGHTFNIPNSVVQVKVEEGTIPAMLPSANTPSSMITTEYFKKGAEPTETSPRFNRLSNVTGLDVTKDGTNAKLSWNVVSAPNMITEEYLNTIYAQKDKYINIYNSENASILGTLGYNVYLKNNDGSLKFLGWTSNTSYIHTPTNSGTLTYVVKTCYSIFKSSESTGSTFTLSDNPYVSIITANLSGLATISITKGTIYTDPGIKVLEDSLDVTNNATIAITVTNTSVTPNTVTNYNAISKIILDTSKVASYTIKYTATYKEYTETLTRIVNITE
jgi:penicillin-binding protein 1A